MCTRGLNDLKCCWESKCESKSHIALSFLLRVVLITCVGSVHVSLVLYISDHPFSNDPTD